MYDIGRIDLPNEHLKSYLNIEARKDQIYYQLAWNHQVMNEIKLSIEYYELCYKENNRFEYCKKQANKLKASL